MEFEIKSDVLNELLKNEEFKKMYEERSKDIFHYFERLLDVESSYLQIIDLFYYLKNNIKEDEKLYVQERIKNVNRFRNFMKYKLIESDEDIEKMAMNVLKDRISNLKKYSKVSLEDKKFFYNCSNILNEEEMKLLINYYDVEEYEMDSYIEQGKENKRNSKYITLVNELLKLNDNNEIIDFLKDKDFNVGTLKGEVHNILVRNFEPESYDSLYTDLTSKIKIYADYKNKENAKRKIEEKRVEQEKIIDQTLPKAKEVISQFVDSTSNNIGDFCFKNSIEKSDFKKYVEIIKDRDEDLFDKYSQRTEQIKKFNFKKSSDKVRKLANNIENGVIGNNGEIRAFDIVDYYIGKTMEDKSIKEIAAATLERKQYDLISKFMDKNKVFFRPSPLNIKQTLINKDEIDCERDSRGFPIPGTGRLITEEEKLSIINYLKDNKVPLSTRTYNVARKRFINNELFPMDNKTK